MQGMATRGPGWSRRVRPNSSRCPPRRATMPERRLRNPDRCARATHTVPPPPLSFSPELILNDLTRNPNRLGHPKQADNDNEVTAGTETGGQYDTHEGRVIADNRRVQPPASRHGAHCADQLRTYGAHHEVGANADRAPRITDRWYGNEHARDDARDGDAGGAERQASENRGDLDDERDDPPVSPAVRSPDGKMQPALRAFNDLENAA